jgi:pSer/pThr/pTyr-binding forkhead associated (FHA) protein
MAIKLSIMHLGEGEEPREIFFARKRVTLGRDAVNQVILDGDDVSGLHAVLSCDGDSGTVQITDEGSTNGVTVNGALIEADAAVTVSPDDRILIGHHLIKVHYVESAGQDEEDEEGGRSSRLLRRGLRRLRDDGKPDKEPEERIEAVNGEFPTIIGAVGTKDIVDLNFNAFFLFSIKGSVFHRGKPLAGVMISAGALGQRETDSKGRFEFPDVPEHTSFFIVPSKDKFQFEADGLEGKVTGAIELNIVARELFSIRGVVQHNGQPLANVQVDGGQLGITTTNTEGVYEFHGVPEGTDYKITPRISGFKVVPNA